MNKLILFIILSVIFSGCATREYVHTQIAPLNSRIDAMDARLAVVESDNAQQGAQLDRFDKSMTEVQVTLKIQADRLTDHEQEVLRLSNVAQQALERAHAAGVLAQGKMAYEVVLTDDKLKFPVNTAELGGVAEAALDAFVARLTSENKNVYIEIQGHTDSIGEPPFNLKLGQARADAVKRYLNIKGGIPLHRMSTVSYGESEPIADNRYQAGRAQNRRVVLVVIQ